MEYNKAFKNNVRLLFCLYNCFCYNTAFERASYESLFQWFKGKGSDLCFCGFYGVKSSF